MALILAVWIADAAFAQASSAVPRQANEHAQTEAAGPSPVTSVPSRPEKKISPQEAERLFRSVDEILKFASKETELPIKAEVKRELVDRDAVAAYVQKHMNEDDDAQRLRRSELVLKKFGLLPRTFELHNFMIKLLAEQVAGFYNEKSKTMNLLDWVEL